MTYKAIIVERIEAVVRVTLNRPDSLNALNLQMLRELKEIATSLAADSSVRAVLLTGQGRGFCSGADIVNYDLPMDDTKTLGQNIGGHVRNFYNPAGSAWAALPMPLIVAVNGVAAGAGMSLALAGDIVVAARSARFIQVFAPKLGLVPDVGSTFHLLRLIGSARAKGLAMLGDALPAEKAVAWGLIWECVDDAELQDHCLAMAHKLSKGPTNGFRKTKQLLSQSPCATIDDQMVLEADAQEELAGTADYSEAIAAFSAKRQPAFTGK
jgi:2-(1,2-epoxy-1,2-dihydrophenyl)acetyl-CoA isomerase